MIDVFVAIFGTLTWMGTMALVWILRQYDKGGTLRSLRLYFFLGWIAWTLIMVMQMLSGIAHTPASGPITGHWYDAFRWMLHEELSFAFAVLFMPLQALSTLLLIYAVVTPRIIPVKPIDVAEIGMNLQGRIVEWNEATEQLLGWPAAEVMGLALAATIIPEEYRQAHLDGMERFRQTGAAPLLNKLYPVVALCKEGQGTPMQKRVLVDLNLTMRTDTQGTQLFIGRLTPRSPLV